MQLGKYQKEARKTAIYPNLGKNLHYPALGICGEWGEFCGKLLLDNQTLRQKKNKEALLIELGDMLWYVANLATEIEISLESIILADRVFKLERPFQEMAEVIGKIAEIVKKTERDNQGRLTDIAREFVTANLVQVLRFIGYFASELGSSLEKVAEANIKKLTSRKKRNQLRGSGDNR